MRNRLLLLLVAFLFVLNIDPAFAGERDKFLIIHLDGVASSTLLTELENGSLPNLASLFSSGNYAKTGITIFPAETPMVLTRLKRGWDNSQGPTGWAYIDEQTDEFIDISTVFFQMMSQVARESRSQFILQYPLVNHLVGLSLLNLQRLYETQSVVEFYWINTDTTGHLGGLQSQLKSLRRLDYYLGLAARTNQFADLNLVLYTDHGASLDDVSSIKYKKLISEVLGENLRFVYYPNVFLHDPNSKLELAKKVAEETPVSAAAVKVAGNKIKGFSANGSFEIRAQADRYNYRFSQTDYFGYQELGYHGDYLTKEEWLQLTKDHHYPAATVSLFTAAINPDAGDIVIVLDSPSIPYYVLGPKGHHAGLTRDDMVVPVLYNGPAFKEVEPFSEFWLHELFSKHLTMVDFDAKPDREKHSLSFSYPFKAEAVFSPGYRLKAGASFSQNRFTPWIEYDVYRSFLTRVWLGAGYKQENLRPRFKLETFLGKLSLSWLKYQGVPGQIDVNLRLNEQVELTFNNKMLGVSFFF